MEVNQVQGNPEQVQAPVVEGADNLLKQSNAPQAEDTEYNSLPTGDKEIISNFVKYFGKPKAGQEIIIHNGKPSLLMNINGRQQVKTLQDIFDNYSMSEAGEETLLKAKITAKDVESQKAELGTLMNAFFTDQDLFWDMAREKGYNDAEIGKISAGLLDRVIKNADTPKEVKEAQELKRENERLRAEVAQKKADDEKKESENKTTQEYNQLKKDIYKVMTDNDLLVNEDVAEDIIISIANQMRYASQNQVNLSAEQAWKIVSAKIPSYIDVVYKGLSDNQIRKLLPERIMKIARGENATDLRSTQTSNGMTRSEPKVQKKPASGTKKTFAEMFNK